MGCGWVGGGGGARGGGDPGGGGGLGAYYSWSALQVPSTSTFEMQQKSATSTEVTQGGAC